MHRRVWKKKVQRMLYWGMVIVCLGCIFWFFFIRSSYHFVMSDNLQYVTINDDGRYVELYNVPAQDVGEVIAYYDASISDADRIFPVRDTKIFNGDTITIDRDHVVKVEVDGEEKEIHSFREELQNIFVQNNIVVEKNDIVKPGKNTVVREDVDAAIIRVVIKEESETKKIPFKKEEREDDAVNFLKRFTEQKGENGTKEIIYEVAYHDGEEVAREIKSETITKEPITEKIVQGTKVVVGKKHTGACSWYSHTGTLSAANPWMPIGSYARVTNQDNGKSVIVRINDRGPFVPGRIIDLDKVAFEKISSLGAGVINVKMEEIIN